MIRIPRILAAAALMFIMVAAAAPAIVHGEPLANASDQSARARARSLFDEGMTRAAAGELEAARRALSESLVLLEKPSTRLNLGIVEVRLGLLTDAHRTLLPLLERADVEAKTHERAEALRTEIERRVAVMTLKVTPATATVFIDAMQVPSEGGVLVLALSAGVHQVRVEMAGHEPRELTLRVEAGTRPEETVVLRSVETQLGVGAGTVALEVSLAGGPAQAMPAGPREQVAPAQAPRDPPPASMQRKRVWWWTGAAVLGAAGAALAVGLAVRDDGRGAVEKPAGSIGTVELGR